MFSLNPLIKPTAKIWEFACFHFRFYHIVEGGLQGHIFDRRSTPQWPLNHLTRLKEKFDQPIRGLQKVQGSHFLDNWNS